MINDKDSVEENYRIVWCYSDIIIEGSSFMLCSINLVIRNSLEEITTASTTKKNTILREICKQFFLFFFSICCSFDLTLPFCWIIPSKMSLTDIHNGNYWIHFFSFYMLKCFVSTIFARNKYFVMTLLFITVLNPWFKRFTSCHIDFILEPPNFFIIIILTRLWLM